MGTFGGNMYYLMSVPSSTALHTVLKEEFSVLLSIPTSKPPTGRGAPLISSHLTLYFIYILPLYLTPFKV